MKMSDTNITVHLSSERKKRLEALIAHSEYSGHGSITNYIRELIDETAAAHEDIDFESPDVPSEDDDEWAYDPNEFDGILDQEQVHKILNTEQSPAIDRAHLPRTWTPNRRIDTSYVITAVYRFSVYELGESKASIENSVKYVVGSGSRENMVREYRNLVKNNLDDRGTKASNIDGNYTVGFDADDWVEEVEPFIETDDAELVSVATADLHDDLHDLVIKGEKMDDERVDGLMIEFNDVVGDVESIISWFESDVPDVDPENAPEGLVTAMKSKVDRGERYIELLEDGDYDRVEEAEEILEDLRGWVNEVEE